MDYLDSNRVYTAGLPTIIVICKSPKNTFRGWFHLFYRHFKGYLGPNGIVFLRGMSHKTKPALPLPRVKIAFPELLLELAFFQHFMLY